MFKSKKKMFIVLVLIAVAASGTWFFISSQKAEEPVQTQTNDVSSQSDKDVSAIIADTKSFSTFSKALESAGLTASLQADGPFTVLVPNDKAFSKLPEGTLDNLLLPENLELLKSLINYHIIASKIMSSELTDGQRVPTVNGAELTVKVADGSVSFVDSKGTTALVLSANIEGSNGVIHEQDSVLIPQ